MIDVHIASMTDLRGRINYNLQLLHDMRVMVSGISHVPPVPNTSGRDFWNQILKHRGYLVHCSKTFFHWRNATSADVKAIL